MSADVVIAGAGPAGVATAVALVRQEPKLAGRIVIFDRARFPRAKPCGGGLTGHARAALEALGLEVRVPFVPCDEGRIVFGRLEREVAMQRPVDVVRREDFDADLVAQARARGISVLEGEGVAEFSVDRRAGLVRVKTTAGREGTARVLVGADGAGSRVRKALVGDQIACRPLRLFRAELPAPRDLGRCMIYDFSPMADGLRGYVWLFPVAGGRVNVGVMHYPSRRLSGGALEDLLRRSLRRHGVEVGSAARGWPAWAYHPRAEIAAPHVMCVGDAAGIDALTGEGIAVGLEHGIVAADVIVKALRTRDFRFVGYRQAIRRSVVGRELALDRRLARMLYGTSSSRLWLSLVMFDRRMQELYAARVSGSTVLADRSLDLAGALVRHVVRAPRRLRRLAEGAPAWVSLGA
ncbi:MAG TPA: FAD-dependent monooxygenase [Polyangia bacterium]|nr:FAD-dependent monooxygenase [Polyangia bacterium]